MRLKEVREEKGLSQKVVAEKIGINRVTLSNIENGKRKLDAVTLYKLSKLYNVDPYKLMDYKEPEIVKFAYRDKDNITVEAKNKLKIIEKYINKIIELENL